MLVLSRKVQQCIQIGDNISVLICSIQGDRVLIGIECDKSIRVLRSEILQLIPLAETVEKPQDLET